MKNQWAQVITCKKCGRFLVGLGCASCSNNAQAVLVIGVHCPFCKLDFLQDVILSGPKKVQNNS